MYTSCYEMRLRHSKPSEIWIKVNSLWLSVHSLPCCFNHLLYQNDHFLNFKWRKLACLHQRCTKWFRGKNSVRRWYFEFTEIFKSALKTILESLVPSPSSKYPLASFHYTPNNFHGVAGEDKYIVRPAVPGVPAAKAHLETPRLCPSIRRDVTAPLRDSLAAGISLPHKGSNRCWRWYGNKHWDWTTSTIQPREGVSQVSIEIHRIYHRGFEQSGFFKSYAASFP